MKQLLQDFNHTENPYSKGSTILDLFDNQVRKTPEALALISGQVEITYMELEAASNRVAHYLLSKGLKEEIMVPVFMERSVEMVIAIMGILKAGAAYIPIDPEFPQERIQSILLETEAFLIITDRANCSKLKTKEIIELLVWEEIQDLLQSKGNNKPIINPKPHHLAYVIFTSGSTGKPKGVLIEHAQLFSSTLARNQYYPAWGTVLLVPSIAFDASVAAVFGSITNGNCLLLSKLESIKNARELEPLLAITDTILCIPSYYRFLLDEGLVKNSRLSIVIVGGEVLDQETISLHFAQERPIALYNEYGPTEATVWCTVQKIEQNENLPSIGAPISNTQIYILDPEGSVLPEGSTGELHIAGDGIARGYLNQAELTAQKFLENPFSKKPGSKMYKSGDLAYWRPDGSLVYKGRIDDQVKIQGHRIELGEIETVITQTGKIKQALITTYELENGTRQLLAYVVPHQKFDLREIKDMLKVRLPGYMVPSLWMELKAFPLNPSGKIDKQALPPPVFLPSNKTQERYIWTGLEKNLGEIWKNLLHLDRINIEDDFFSLGGNSLLAMRVIAQIRKDLKIDLGIKDFFANPSLNQLAEFLQLNAETVALPAIRKGSPGSQPIPLSYSQESLWFIDQLEGSTQYHLPMALRIMGDLDIKALQQALQELVSRHQVLRTVIRGGDNFLEQYLLSEENWELSLIMEENYKEDEPGFQHLFRKLAYIPFDLSKDYMMRASLVRLDDRDHVLILVLHHIAFDAWSTPLFFKDLLDLYHAYSKNIAPTLPSLPIQYADFAKWQKENIDDSFLEKKAAYWKYKLTGLEPLQLPTDKPRSLKQKTTGALSYFTIEPGVSLAIGSLAKKEGATLFMTLLAAFKVLLYRYSAQQDICVGTAVAGRQAPETEDLIGYFINTLALRTRVEGKDSFLRLLQHIKNTTLEAFENQELPFEKVVASVGAERVYNQNPLFQVMFLLQNLPKRPPLSLEGAELSFLKIPHETSKFELTFSLTETAKGIVGIVEYRTDLFSSRTIEGMVAHYKELLNSLVNDPETSIGNLNILPPEEEQRLLLRYNDTAVDYPKNKTILDLLEEQVKLSPQAPAIFFETEQITYQELDERSNQWAHLLRRKGVKKETFVLIGIERSIEMIIGMIAVLKAGGTYIPIDPAYPLERIRFVQEDSGARILLSSRASQFKMPQFEHLETINMERAGILPADLPITKPDSWPEPQQLAYVIYTSGSTGSPKGVMIGHDNVYSFINWCKDEFGSSRFDLVYAATSICFDLSIFEIFFPLTIGKPIRLLENALQIRQYLTGDAFVMINTVPSVVQNLIEEHTDWSKVSVLNMAGESVPAYVLENLDTESIEVRNLYGPTEDTTYSTVYKLDKEKPILIGKPIANTKIYILNKEGALVPEKVPGEICISGAGVAKGYLNRKSLTAEKFIANPFGEGPFSVLYKTGDLGRWSEGNIEFIGREDGQVKIRGFRIELGEIERVLQQLNGVRESVVLAKINARGEKQLVGYVVAGNEIDEADIVNYLKGKLPSFMIPAQWLRLDKFPMTPNGKINKNALPDPHEEVSASSEFASPRNPQEDAMCGIWKEILKRDGIGIHDNFFQLGGHSLLATSLILAIRNHFKVEIKIKALFDHPTIAGLTEQLGLGSIEIPDFPVLKSFPRPDNIPLSFSQESLWFIDQLEGSVPYHLPSLLRINGPLDVDALKNSLQMLLERHEVLRTVIRNTEGKPWQQILEPADWRASLVDAAVFDKEPEALQDYIRKIISQPFDLAHDYMFRASLIRLGPEEHILVMIMHHIASDGWSIALLIRDLEAFYRAALNQAFQKPLPLPIQYADYALWQRKTLTDAFLEIRGKYWKEKLRDLVPLHLPTDYPRPEIQSYRGSTFDFSIDRKFKIKLLSMAQEQGATLYMTLLAGFKLMLNRLSSQTDICVGTATAGRNHPETEDLIGYFINPLPLRTKLEKESTFKEFLQSVKVTCLEAFENQEMPFDKIVVSVGAERDLGKNPLFQVMFLLQNLPQLPKPEVDGVKITPVSFSQTTSKFDITFILTDNPSGIEGTVEFATDLFKEKSIQKMIHDFMEILESMVSEPERKIEKTVPYKDQSGREFAAGMLEINEFLPVHQLIAQAAEKFGGEPAIYFLDQWISYQELNESANQLAHYLIQSGVKTGDILGIVMDRSIEMVVAVLATLKAGGIYLPIDTDFPVGRVNYFLDDASAKFLITQEIYQDSFSGNVPVIIYEKFSVKKSGFASANPDIPVQRNDAAYLIYTSGSTGKPKGVLIEHGNLSSLIAAAGISPGISASDKILGTTSISFDVSILELLLPFVFGAKLYLTDKYQRKDPEEIIKLIAYNKITYLFATPTLWKLLLNGGWTKTFPFLNAGSAGEPLSKELATRLIPLCKSVWNLYGPTETTVFSTIKQVKDADEEITIGKPIPNTEVYILKDNLEPVKEGEEGELYISGQGVGRGYLKRDKLSSEKFLEDPFHPGGSRKMYRTGDMGRFSSNGEIKFSGRRDQQIKLRGHRIELGEIEHALSGFKDIKDALVVVREDETNPKLVAYIILSEKVKTGKKQKQDSPEPGKARNFSALTKQWKRELSLFLPAVMVPTDFVVLEYFPQTASGKIDRKALPAPDSLFSEEDSEPILAETHEEKLITQIWEEALQIKNLKITDNFFEIGGHSLIAIQVMTRLEKESGIKLPLSILFKYPTVQKLALALKSKEKGVKKWNSLVPIKPFGHKAPLYIVHGAGLNVLPFYSIANNLDPGQPVYGLQAKGLNGIDEPLTSVEEIAAHYITEILEHNPRGPYALAGYSFGGILVFEMAKQLKANGKEVERLILFDTYAYLSDHKESWFVKLTNQIRYSFGKRQNDIKLLLKHPATFKNIKLISLRKKMDSVLKYLNLQNSQPEPEIIKTIKKIEAIHKEASKNYEFKKYDGSLYLLRAKIRTNYIKDPVYLGWKPYVDQVNIIEVDGKHTTMFTPPHDKKFAQVLQEILDGSGIPQAWK